MQYFFRILILVIAGIFLFYSVPSNGQEGQRRKAWKGLLADGTVISKAELSEIINSHKRWLYSAGRKGKQADFKGAKLSGADLSGYNLRLSILREADLTGVNLIGTTLRKANMIKADLSMADLSEADLSEADMRVAKLIEAKLWKTNLSQANLYLADLSRADLKGSDLRDARLFEAVLSEVDLREAKLKGAKLIEADLSGADLRGTVLREVNLSEADLSEADLREADLGEANLSKAILNKTNLRGTGIDETTQISDKWKLVWEILNHGPGGKNLRNADLSEADLRNIDLSMTDLDGADLSGADLREADLSEAGLREAELSEANLGNVDLSNADLSGANLSSANLSNADLMKSDLNGADLTNTNLSGAEMSKVRLVHTNLRETWIDETTQISDKWRLVWEILNNSATDKNLRNADLSDADLRYVDLSQIDLSGADLSGADLSEANLSAADLRKANLSKARLTDVNLNDAIVSGVNLTGSQYEATSSPHRDFLGGLRGLSTVWFEAEKQSGLLMLRAALKDAGLRNLERQATYAIEYFKTKNLPWYKKWTKRFLFEWTSGYGLHYLRPLLILCAVIILFSLVYIYPMFVYGKSGIYRIWPHRGAKDEKEKDEPERLIYDILPNNQIEKDFKFFLVAAVYALYFSFLSTFHIGYLNLNFGNWITRIQPHEYYLSATGNVRIFSGLQSLLGTYLLAIWFLTHFFRPF